MSTKKLSKVNNKRLVKQKAKPRSRELKLLEELKTKFGYQLFEMRDVEDRWQSISTAGFSNKKPPKVLRVVRLGVPLRSNLGRMLTNEDKRWQPVALKTALDLSSKRSEQWRRSRRTKDYK